MQNQNLERVDDYRISLVKELRKSKANEIARLVDKATIFRQSVDKGYRLLLYVPQPDLKDYGPQTRSLILGASKQCINPLINRIDVSVEEVLPLPHRTSLLKHDSGISLVPVFGLPSSDKQYECDVFMIMPFADKFRPVFDAIRPTVSALGLKISRADEPFSQHEIMHDIWSMINACKIAIADCTGRNPNVFYEIGVAHAIGKPVILIAQDIEHDVPFDLRHRRTIAYELNGIELNSEFRDRVQKAVQKMLDL